MSHIPLSDMVLVRKVIIMHNIENSLFYLYIKEITHRNSKIFKFLSIKANKLHYLFFNLKFKTVTKVKTKDLIMNV